MRSVEFSYWCWCWNWIPIRLLTGGLLVTHFYIIYAWFWGAFWESIKLNLYLLTRSWVFLFSSMAISLRFSKFLLIREQPSVQIPPVLSCPEIIVGWLKCCPHRPRRPGRTPIGCGRECAEVVFSVFCTLSTQSLASQRTFTLLLLFS